MRRWLLYIDIRCIRRRLVLYQRHLFGALLLASGYFARRLFDKLLKLFSLHVIIAEREEFIITIITTLNNHDFVGLITVVGLQLPLLDTLLFHRS